MQRDFCNNNILCNVPKKDKQQADDTTRMARMDKSTELVVLTVAENATVRAEHHTMSIVKGMVAYVKSDQLSQRWATTRVKLNGEEFVLVPFSEVVATGLE